MAIKTHSIFDPSIMLPAIGESFIKLNPITLAKNPVILVTEVGAAISSIFLPPSPVLMKTAENVFVVPTYRLRDVGATIEAYDEHFWSNGHSVKMMVFDDSSLANHEKYFSRLEHTKTVNDLYYVGPHEKEQFLSFLEQEASGPEARGVGPKYFPAKLRWKPKLCFDIHPRCVHDQRR